MSESRAQQASVTRAQVEPPADEPAQSRFAERLRAALDHQRDPAIDRSRDGDPVARPRSARAQQLHDALYHERAHSLDNDRGADIEI